MVNKVIVYKSTIYKVRFSKNSKHKNKHVSIKYIQAVIDVERTNHIP